MSEIIYLLRDTETFKNRYKDKYELLYNDYREMIQNSIKSKNAEIKYVHFEAVNMTASSVDLIIAEDNFDTISNLVKNALDCSLVNTILVCDDLSTLEKVLADKKMRPKVLTLDFMFKGIESVHPNIINETLDLYKKVKIEWPDVPVLGITNHAKDDEVTALLEELNKHGDDYYNKRGIYEALPDILRNRIEYFKIDNFKTVTAPLTDLKELAKNVNMVLIKKGIVLKDEKMVPTLTELLDLQEKVLKFIFNNGIKYKSTTLAGAMLFCKANLEAELSELFFTRLNTTSKEIYQGYNLPNQPLSSVQRYFQAIDDNEIVTKEALIILELFKTYPTRWPLSIEKAKQKDPSSPAFVTFLDNLLQLTKQLTFITL